MSKNTDVIRRVYTDEGKACIEVGPDADGLGLVELRTTNEISEEYFGKIRAGMSVEVARSLGSALIAAANEAEANGA